MPPRPARRRKKIRTDSVLFAIVFSVLVIGFGAFAVYQNGYFRTPDFEFRGNQSKTEEAPVSTGTSDLDDTTLAKSTAPADQLTLLTESQADHGVYQSLTESERESLRRMADAIDATLNRRRYEGELSEADLAVADRYSNLFHPVRWRDYWYRTAVKTAGFSRLQRLRHRGDEDEFKSAAVAWVRLDGLTRGLLLEALQAIADEDEELQTTLQDAIQQYPFIIGIEEPVTPLRAPRP